ncbi:MAG: Crp/Fnr family transcriptional regulator [Eubacteriales bacterium]|nr:Crp/Fnr family transcriptional regulator [Eubacteriales bacterium]
MKDFFDILRECPLFDRIGDESLKEMLGCLNAKECSYKKGDVVFAEGDKAKYLGIVLEGSVQLVRVDYYGNRSILANIEPPQLFGEAFACAGLKSLPVDAVAAADTKILLLDAQRIARPCGNACPCHGQTILNLLHIVAKKNLVLHQKIEITSKRSTREKLMTYLLLQAKNAKSHTFTVPYDRQELADYLEVDRSGLSAEISKLRNEKVLECRRSTFTLL